jgi:DNA-binding transcriptional ArsR family regulator
VSGAFDATIHAPHRLRIAALLAAVDGADFQVVRDAVDVSDSVLSKQVKVLEDAGYVKVSKETRKGRVWTTLALTRAGRRAYDGHVEALREIVAAAPPSPTT